MENGFSNLPRGTFIQLEKQAKDYILRNIKQTTINRKRLVQKMKYFQADTGLPLTLGHFVGYYGMSLFDFYGGRNGNRTIHGLMVEAGLVDGGNWENGEYLTKRIPALLSLNSRRLLKFLIKYLEELATPNDNEEQLMLNMFYYTFYRSEPKKVGYNSIEEALQATMSYQPFRQEVLEILRYSLGQIRISPLQRYMRTMRSTSGCSIGRHKAVFQRKRRQHSDISTTDSWVIVLRYLFVSTKKRITIRHRLFSLAKQIM